MSLKRPEVEHIAKEHGISVAAVESVATAMEQSRGAAAQFNHPELGGLGQWMSGGMLMIGDMFNHELKAKVDRVCRSVAAAILARPDVEERDVEKGAASHSDWWPREFGRPASTGAQNAMRYAIFPACRRLVVDNNGELSIYDTGGHVLNGISQQQSGTQLLSFSSVEGPIELSRLKRLK